MKILKFYSAKNLVHWITLTSNRKCAPNLIPKYNTTNKIIGGLIYGINGLMN